MANERLVTEADLDEPVCECGHPAEFHPETAGSDSYHATWSVYRYVKCSCAKTREGVRLAHLDSIVRREVAKALDEVVTILEDLRDDDEDEPNADYGNGRHDTAERALFEVRKLRAGGQS